MGLGRGLRGGPVPIDDLLHPALDAGLGGFIQALPDGVALQAAGQLGPLLVQGLPLLELARARLWGFLQGRLQVAQAVGGLAQLPAGGGEVAAQGLGLRLEGGYGRIIGRFARRGDGLEREGLRRALGAQAVSVKDVQRHAVAARRYQRPFRVGHPGRLKGGLGQVDGVWGGQPHVPGQAVEAGGGGPFQPADGRARGVADQQAYLRGGSQRFFPQTFPAGEGGVLARATQAVLARLTALLWRWGQGGQVVGDQRAHGRVFAPVGVGALAGHALRLHGNLWDIPPAVPHGEERGFRAGQRLGQAAQAAVVVQHIEAPAKGGSHQVVFAGVQLQVAEGDGGHPAGEPVPVQAQVGGGVEAVLGAGEEEVSHLMVLLEDPDDGLGGELAGKRTPGTAPVGADEEVRPQVAQLVGIGGGKDGIRVVRRGLQVVDEGAGRHVRQGGGGAPVLAPVFAHVDEAVVGAGVEQALDQGRFGDGGQGGVLGHGPIVVEGVHAPHPVDELQLVAVGVGREVGADGGPGVTAGIAAPETL